LHVFFLRIGDLGQALRGSANHHAIDRAGLLGLIPSKLREIRDIYRITPLFIKRFSRDSDHTPA
jgi:hypothetical protein